ncbi:3-deoxy-manno-octulosonate cytidylyltransferase [Odoribacter lunatus]|uniref:3-deoxy-manno-octulosonate cytidylyltransferase n=1 Tax=Odoribacter lunatus TaxID=2941335 RepID=UPI00203E46AD|nr:3-deoxy-manno-octulosonate cytidylyltransferase [Odoribacter lunatus]
MKVLILIPARYASTRFPGKPLAEIGGRPMIQHVVEKALSVTDDVYVATDDRRISEKIEAFGGKAIMTSSDHRSGTDRCFEAYEKVIKEKHAEYDVVVNIQGDEPFIVPQQIRQLIQCFENQDVQIATLAKPFEDNEALFDSNKVKVVFSSRNTAIYFSRSPIPFARGLEKSEWLDATTYYKHIGMYAYRPSVLREITLLPPGKLEKIESLEQLRWLENGYTIAVGITEHESIGIDTPEDLERAKALL